MSSDAGGNPPFRLRYASHLGVRSTEEPLFRATAGSADPVIQIEYAAAQGFAGVEDNFLKDRSVRDQERIGEALAAHGMELGCFAASLDLRDGYWGRDDEESGRRIDVEIAAAIEVGERANGRYAVVAAARDLRVPPGYQRAAMARHLRRVAPRLERAGLVLCLEQTSERRLPGMLLHHLPDAYSVVDAVSSPSVKLLFDFVHVQLMDGDVLGHLERAWDGIGILQIADPPDRTELGRHELDWVNILRAVSARGYRGLIEYEVIPSRPGVEGEQAALAALREIDAAL